MINLSNRSLIKFGLVKACYSFGGFFRLGFVIYDNNSRFNLLAGGGGINRLYFGVEFFMNYSDTRSKAFVKSLSASQDRAKFTAKYSTGSWVGYIFSKNPLLYSILGADITKFKVQSDNGFRYSSFYNVNKNISPKTSRTFTGFIAGIGSEALIGRHFSLRFQYAASLFSHFTDKYENHDSQGRVGNGKMDYTFSRCFCSLTLTYYFRFSKKKI